MSSSGSRPNFQPSQALVNRLSLEMQRSFTAIGGSWGHHVDSTCDSILFQPSSKLATRWLHLAFDNGPINFFNGSFPELFSQPGGRLAGSCEKQNPRHHAGHAMNDP